ncbi:MAG TPA: response regulator transcription factor [Actinomycetota bacterium]|nr:response regulator transcription factor [Actinomycetota bacterium]
MESPQTIRVVVVDDHEMLVQGLRAALAMEGDIEVVASAGSVEDACASVRMHAPDVVLMDFELPDGDGAVATERIKADLPSVQVVMVTSFDDEAVLVRAIEAGCSGFITKHKAISEVASAVRAASSGEALISPSMLARLLPRLRRKERGVGVDLTPREMEILKYLAAGMSNAAIAERLVLSLHTVRNHVQNVIGKLGAHSKLEAVATAVREGILRQA